MLPLIILAGGFPKTCAGVDFTLTPFLSFPTLATETWKRLSELGESYPTFGASARA
jgi:hypothetical protein